MENIELSEDTANVSHQTEKAASIPLSPLRKQLSEMNR